MQAEFNDSPLQFSSMSTCDPGGTLLACRRMSLQLELSHLPLIDLQKAELEDPLFTELLDEFDSSYKWRQQSHLPDDRVRLLQIQDALAVQQINASCEKQAPSSISSIEQRISQLQLVHLNNVLGNYPALSMMAYSSADQPAAYLLAYQGIFPSGYENAHRPLIILLELAAHQGLEPHQSNLAAGKVLRGFLNLLKDYYLQRGESPVIVSAMRKESSLALLLRHRSFIEKQIGCFLRIAEIDSLKSLHESLIIMEAVQEY